MDESSFRKLISGETRGIGAVCSRGMLRALSLGYSAATTVRNLAYGTVPGMVHRVPVPVISVGNITTGGTGKTPVVAMIVQMLQGLEKRPGIVSRGYRASKDGTNDENMVLGQQCPGVPHEQNASRILAANRLISGNEIDVIVMDDGFQHRRLHRALNIVLIDATNPFGYGCLLPRGLLRESLRSLKRADLILITRSDLVSESERHEIEKSILRHAPTKNDRILSVSFQPTALVRADGERTELGTASGKSAFLMSGIGNPPAFRATCECLRTVVVGEAIFADHHHYTAEDLEQVLQTANSCAADLVLTTQKDLVKLPVDLREIVAVEVGCQFSQETQRQQFMETLEHTVVTTNTNHNDEPRITK
jgi:tetraacyldisaccharide 4'-kinase